MSSTEKHRHHAETETTKRLLAQLANEGLLDLELAASMSPPVLRGINPISGGMFKWIEINLAHGSSGLADDINRSYWRPNDFCVPVVLCSDESRTFECDPGVIFQFLGPWNMCDQAIEDEMARELRSSVDMGEKWLELAAGKPALHLDSPFIDWEGCLLHRTCVAHTQRGPEHVHPDTLPDMLTPGLSFLEIPRSAVQVFGDFHKLTEPLFQLFDIDTLTLSEGTIIVPCLMQQLPAVTDHFPEAAVLKSIPGCAKAQASIRTITIPGYDFDLKMSLSYQLTSALRVTEPSRTAAALDMTNILKSVLPPDLWVMGEIASITGSHEDPHIAGQLGCIIRENFEAKARARNERLILVSALIEKPYGETRTYAEILFNLETTRSKVAWFISYLRCLLHLGLDPLRRHAIGLELHPQNTLVRICRNTKTIKGLAIRDLAGIYAHGPTLSEQGYPVANIAGICFDDIYRVWGKVHHALIQNNCGYMLSALQLDDSAGVDGWGIVRSVLSEVLDTSTNDVGRELYRFWTRETMPFRCFLRTRMNNLFRPPVKMVNRELPNLLCHKSQLFLPVSLAASKAIHSPILAQRVDPASSAMERNDLYSSIANKMGGRDKVALLEKLYPNPVLVPSRVLRDLDAVQEALSMALASIVERWWKDEKAAFPSRMPMGSHVEDLLKWVDQSTDDGLMKPFHGHEGNWRPDFLLPVSTKNGAPQFQICEINARFPLNYIFDVACHCEATAASPWSSDTLQPGTQHQYVFDSLFKLFNPELRVYFLRESLDKPLSTALLDMFEERTGMRPKIVSPYDLRLVPSTNSATGFVLGCTRRASIDSEANEEAIEEIHQVALQLFDHELFSLPRNMVRHIAMCSVNDVRSVFMIADKRILGIVREELEDLTTNRHVLQPRQAQLLRDALVPTILPSSIEFRDIVARTASDPEKTKDEFILKAVRQARGEGILIGKDISAEQWKSVIDFIEEMSSQDEDCPPPYVLQPLVSQKSLDWPWGEERKMEKVNMVGTYYAVNGQFVGCGRWRVAPESERIICAKNCSLTTSVFATSKGEIKGK
ncbi:IucC family-domain-containing protein [Xylariales sp. PMI_506]|nr:IucC family-domain-containing protein [Xylariales sp. PMI_506]